MTGLRATIRVAACALVGLAAVPATAQVSDGVVLNIMRECAKIDDATARLACYDNNIRSGGAAPARSSVPGRMDTPETSRGAAVSTTGRSGFGAEDIRTPERFESGPGELDRLSSRIASITPLQPGVYRFTLDDGAEWVFSESVDRTYRAPRRGSTVEIERGALGSFLMHFDDQGSVRIRRLR